MSENYSLASAGEASPVRRIVLIGVFLSVSIVAVSHFRHAIAPNAASIALEKPLGLASDGANRGYDDIVQNAVTEALKLPEPSSWKRVVVAKGQSLSNVFESEGLPPEDWMSMIKLNKDSSSLRRIRAGDQLNLRIVAGRLEELTYPIDEARTLSIRRQGSSFQATTLTTSLEHRPGESVGVIRNSLFADGNKAGLSGRMILELADIFGYDIDFAQDLQEGDRFAVVYDQLFKDGKRVRKGDILAAEFVNQGRSYRAVRYVDRDGRIGYYTPEGQSLRKAFIRTPVDFARISSGFNLHRMHPILNIIRAHKGVDYAAAIGTPVHATGDGKIEFLGRKSGYGNVLMIQHGTQYETVYGHLSRFQTGLRVGGKVRQGQIVAYVGMTGLATAPHLHYEFRINGIHVDPVKAALPRAIPLSPQVLAHFRAQTTPLVAQIETLDNRRVAKLTP